MFEKDGFPEFNAHPASVSRGVVHVHEDQVRKDDRPEERDRAATRRERRCVQ